MDSATGSDPGRTSIVLEGSDPTCWKTTERGGRAEDDNRIKHGECT